MAYTVTANPNPVTEGAGATVTFTITRSGAFPNEAVFVSTLNGAALGYAVNSGDYATNVNNLQVNFAANQTSANVTLSITNDNTSESDETFGLIVQKTIDSNLNNFVAKTNWTIHDDDAVVQPAYTVSANPNPVTEGAGATVTFTITRSGAFPNEAVFVSTLNGAALGYAVNSGDYATNVNNLQVNFAANQTSANVTLLITNDNTPESDETFGLIVQKTIDSNLNNFVAKTNWTIHDDDAVVQPAYSVSANPNPVTEGAGATVTFTITRSGAFPNEAVFVSTLNGAALGYAVNSGDYATNVNNLQVNFAANQTSANVTLSITNDNTSESDETFGLIVQKTIDSNLNNFVAKTNWTIHDDDVVAQPAYTVTANPNPVTEGAGATVTFTITRSGAFPAEAVFVSTLNGAALGYAVNSGDYATNVNNLQVNFAANQTTANVTLSITNDSTPESDETFGLIVQKTIDSNLNNFVAKTNWTIHDDDAVVQPAYTVSANPNPVTEGAGATVTFTITRSGAFPNEAVFVSTLNGAALGYAVNSGDYATNINNLQVNFAANQTTANVTLSITNDSTSESDETFGLIVQKTQDPNLANFVAKTNWTIHDDDAVTSTTWSITPSNQSFVETAGNVAFTVTRSVSGTAQTVLLSTLQNQGGTNAGDYVGKINEAISFAAGDLSKTVTLQIIDDSVHENTESFGLLLEGPVGTTLASTTFTINDNDTAQSTNYSMTPGSMTVNENAGTVTFTVNRSGGLPAETIFASTTQTEGFTNTNDYTGINSQAIAFTSGQTSKTVTVSIINDSTTEPDETFGLIVQRNSNDQPSTFLAKSTFTVHDDDQSQATGYSISPGTVTANENAGTMTFTVTRSGSLLAETIYTSTTQTEGFINSNDYTPILSQALTFSSGQTSQTITVSITNDLVAESDEKFGLVVQRNAGDPAGTYLAKSTFTITDNDAATTDDYASSTTTSGAITVGGTANGNIQWLGDTDWFAITLAAGATYQFDLGGAATGQGTLTDPFLRLRDSAGNSIANAYSDDGGTGFDSRFGYTPTSSGTYYLSVGAGFHTDGTGSYTLHAKLNATEQGTSYSISPYPASVTEGNTSLTFTVTRSGTLAAETLYASTVFGSTNGFSYNTGDSDYTGIKNAALSFAAGQASQTVTIQIKDDVIAEGNETFGLVVQRSPNDPVSTYVAHSVFTIVDDEQQSTNYWISPTTPTVTEGTPSLTLTVHRSGGTPAETLYVSTGAKAGGPGNSGDYGDITNQPLVFQQGESEQSFTISIMNDNTPENNESYALLLKRTPGSVPVLQSTFTIFDDDKAPGQTKTEDVFKQQQGELQFLAQFAVDAYADKFPTELSLQPVNFGSSVSGLYSNGIYKEFNAAAMVGRSDDSLFISFAGTNDNYDYVNWLERQDHWALFSPLIVEINHYVSNAANGIKHVYVTGHSLGAAMAQEFMAEHPDSSGLSYQAIAFANPGYGPGLGLGGDQNDSRISNIFISGDAILAAAAPSPIRGDKYYILHESSIDAVALHSQDLYLTVAQEIQSDLNARSGSFPLYQFQQNGVQDSVFLNLNISLTNGVYSVGPTTAEIQDGKLNFFTDSSGKQTLVVTHAGSTPMTISLEDQVIHSSVTNLLTSVAGAAIDFGVHQVINVMAAQVFGPLTIIGSAFDNYLQGGHDDYIFGGGGNDTIDIGVGDGNDTYDGGDGIDTVVYSSATQGIVVNLSLAQNQATGPEIGTDQISNIENVIGGSGDDRITGTMGANALIGGAGNDILVGDAQTSVSADITAALQGTIVQFDGSGFDATRVQNASVVKTASGYALLYGGLTFGNNYQVGLATSSDGLNWSKYSDSPVISNGGSQSWASFREFPATMILDNGVYKLWFNGDNRNLSSDPGYGSGFGYATSTDGINWSFDANNPIRFELNSPSGNGMHLDEVVKLNGQYIAYYTNHNPSGDVLNYAISADGIHFSNDAPLSVPAGYALLAATTANISGTNTVFAVLQDSSGIDHYATSTDGANFTIGGIVNVPSNFSITDVLFDGSQIKFFGDNGVGNVNWSFGNTNIEYATALVSSLAGNTGALAGGNDVLDGGPGNDALTGGPGNDALDGGTGTNTAVYSGLHSDYLINKLSNGSFQISDTRAGSPDGTDTLANIQNFQFADRPYTQLELSPARDLNSDGHSDILWQRADGLPAEWQMNGLTTTSSALIGRNPGANMHEIASGDFDGDGHADILWQGTDGTPAMWLMNGTNIVGEGVIGRNPGPNMHAIATGDFNGDGHADILWQGTDGTPAMWLMNGMNIIGEGVIGRNPGPNMHAIATGDFNGDGYADILWQGTDGTPAMWLMKGLSIIGDGVLSRNPGPSMHEIATGDFNGDGYADILWQGTDGTAAIWLMKGMNIIDDGVIGFNPGPTVHAVATGDFNNDHHSDILWHGDDGTAAMWLMNGLNVTSEGVLGFNPGADWHIIA
jgi:uncharacterized membrane protein